MNDRPQPSGGAVDTRPVFTVVDCDLLESELREAAAKLRGTTPAVWVARDLDVLADSIRAARLRVTMARTCAVSALKREACRG